MSSTTFKDNYIEYHFSNNDGKKLPYTNIELPIGKVQNIFSKFREKYGETEIIKEYSTYKHNDMELTLFPDGACFCRQVTMKDLQDAKVPEWICVTYVEKHKISNDYFPCKYVYNSSKDIVDVIFTVNKDIQIILKTSFENNRNFEKVTSLEKIGKPQKIKYSKKAWCELSVIVDCSCDIEDVYKTIDYVTSQLKK